MLTPEIIEQLKAPFAAEDHKTRKIPGGGNWFYIPWQKLRDRAEQVDPSYELRLSMPTEMATGETIIKCTVTIHGVTRDSLGTSNIPVYNESGNLKGIGTLVENAQADAIRSALEQFGIGAYIDDQAYTAKLLYRQHDSRGIKYQRENEEMKAGARGKPKAVKSESPIATSQPPATPPPTQSAIAASKPTMQQPPVVASGKARPPLNHAELVQAINKGAKLLGIPLDELLDSIESKYGNRLMPTLEIAQLNEIRNNLRDQYAKTQASSLV